MQTLPTSNAILRPDLANVTADLPPIDPAAGIYLGKTAPQRKNPDDSLFFAVKKGDLVQNCIFFNWDDVCKHLTASCEWNIFADIKQAEKYIQEGGAISEKAGAPSLQAAATVNATLDTPQLTAATDETKEASNSAITADSAVVMVTASPAATDAAAVQAANSLSQSKRKNINETSRERKSRKVDSAPNAKWLDMLERFKRYHEVHDSFDILVQRKVRGKEQTQEEVEDAKAKSALRDWVREQDQQFANFQEQKRSKMTEEKIKMLKDIGYHFKYTSFDEHFKVFNEFVAEYPNKIIPQNNIICKWAEQMRIQLERMDRGLKSYMLTSSQATQLKSTGYFARSHPSANNEDDPEWDAMYELLKEHKAKYGHCLVNTKKWDDPLAKWTLAQRRHYLCVQEGGKSRRLTTKKLLKLNEIGFVFRQKDKYKSFEQRVEELKEFKAKNGHLRVPTTLPGLGVWVCHVRDQYRLAKMGREHTLNEDKIEILKDLGFEFRVGKIPIKTFDKRYTWEERFEQLLQYKEQYGDTVVPQHFSGFHNLGAWVKAQRNQYKLMRKGDSRSYMSSEKALRLSEIGFVWEVATGGSVAKRKRETSNTKSNIADEAYSSSDSEDDEPVSRASVGMLALGSPSRRLAGISHNDSRTRYYEYM